ncbi:hypothetical protein Tco_1517893 [Tanacetum coccineum]
MPGSGSLPSKTIANPKGELNAITTRSDLVLDGPSVPMPHLFINPGEDERVKETLTDPELVEYTIKVPPPLVQKDKPTYLNNYVFLEGLDCTKKSQSNHQSGNPTLSSYTDLTLLEVINPLSGNPTPISWNPLTNDFDPEGDLRLIEELLNNDPSSPLPLSHNPLSGSTTSSSPDHLLEELADELTLITFPPGNDDLPSDIEGNRFYSRGFD